ncbi:MAG TPA: hypothetical protein VLS89_13435 [Candidatus Nanopelagicales bacterium]|nr:hypothetical protein [Candidatus Nanopelagicales bacterium]
MNPKISPASTEKLRSSTATTFPYRLPRPCTSIAAFIPSLLFASAPLGLAPLLGSDGEALGVGAAQLDPHAVPTSARARLNLPRASGKSSSRL